MSAIEGSPRRLSPLYIGLIFVFVIFIGFIVASILVARHYFEKYILISPPPARAMYLGTDEQPTNLPATAALFAPSSATFNPATFSSQVLPPAPADPATVVGKADEIASAVNPAVTFPPPPQDGHNPKNEGLLICDPVSPPATPQDIRNLGAGSRQWLTLIVAGRPEFGRTAAWFDTQRIEYELHRTDLCLEPSATPVLATMAGVTDVACGSITGTAAKCSLSYQLYALPNIAPVGPPVTVTGSADQVTRSLPLVAEKLESALGLSRQIVPDVHLTTSQLGWIATGKARGNQRTPTWKRSMPWRKSHRSPG